MVNVNWTDKAQHHLQDIHGYIAQDSKFFAKRTILNLIQKTDILGTMPKFGRIVPEFNQDEIREIIYKNYRIVYKIVSPTKIDIVSVSHGTLPLENLGIYPTNG